MTRHFLDISAFDGETLRGMIAHSRALKQERRTGEMARPLTGKNLAMIFESPSTRTRVSFEVAIRDLGGEAVILSGGDMQIGRGESIPDTARVLSRYVDAIMIRALNHDQVVELAEHATIPVINGLTKRSHPCQIMADIMAYEEHRESISGRKIAWLGDSNNVLASWVHAAARLDFTLAVATPPELAPDPTLLAWARENGADVQVSNDAHEAAADADCIVTDAWVSMGDDETETRHNLLKPYQANAALMASAKDSAVFMHCLPAHRGEEVTADVIDGPQSIVFDEAENRLHTQKAILAWCLGVEPQ